MERNFFLLILFLGLALGSDTFWFSYKSVTLNKTLIYEQKHISPLTIPYLGKSLSTCRVKIQIKKCYSKLECLNLNFYKILPCFYGSTAKVTSQTQVTLDGIKDETELIIVPTRFIVDFKDDFANITILK